MADRHICTATAAGDPGVAGTCAGGSTIGWAKRQTDLALLVLAVLDGRADRINAHALNIAL
jgi:hypothetical protein